MTHCESEFWKDKDVREMTRGQWDALCDGCGRCCLEKFKDRDTGKVYYTRLACRYLDLDTCRCRVYSNRTRLVPDCEWLIPAKIQRYRWLPKTCAYRLVMENKELAWWHPLVSGDPETVHLAGMSVRSIAISCLDVPKANFEDYILENNIWARAARIDL